MATPLALVLSRINCPIVAKQVLNSLEDRSFRKIAWLSLSHGILSFHARLVSASIRDPVQVGRKLPQNQPINATGASSKICPANMENMRKTPETNDQLPIK